MKSIIASTGLLTLILVILTSFSMDVYPQDPPQGEKIRKRIKMVKVDEAGNRTEIDTVITHNDHIVVNGDTIFPHEELKWVSKEDLVMDIDVEMDVDEDGKRKVIIMKSGEPGQTKIHEFVTEGDSGEVFHIRMNKLGHDHDMMKWHSDEDENVFIHSGKMPPSPKLFHIREEKSGNVIDLSDPGIISYDRKELKNGREKITIIREKPSDDVKIKEEIIIQGDSGEPVMFHGKGPKVEKRIKVIKDEDGNVEVIEE